MFMPKLCIFGRSEISVFLPLQIFRIVSKRPGCALFFGENPFGLSTDKLVFTEQRGDDFDIYAIM